MPQSPPPRRPSREAEPDAGNAELRSNLRIDDDDLDQCLVEQPGYFFNAAEALSMANSEREAKKLELKEVIAELDQDIRRQALENEEKLSENSIANRLTTLPRIKALQRELLALAKTAEDYAALKDAYIQRSYALKDLVSIQLARFNNLNVERGSVGARNNVADRARAQGEQQRRDRATGGSTPRYQPRDQGD